MPGDACAVERAADALHCRWIDAEPLGNEQGAGEPAVAVTLAACLEPKMADTVFPKTLIFAPPLLSLQDTSRWGDGG
jgi:hypothetical protein